MATLAGEAFRRVAAGHASRPAVVEVNSAEITFEGLSTWSQVIAAVLEQHGARPGHRLAIILQNLIGNAVKHAGNGAEGKGTVRVSAERASDRGRESWIVSVADDGPGIPPDQVDHLFEAFTRLPQPDKNTSDDQPGYGLGLAIAAQAARLLGETIQVQTCPGQGSRFAIRVDYSA